MPYTPKPEALVLKNQGNVCVEVKDYEGALALYQQALEIDPTFPQALNNAGQMLMKLERHEEALTYFTQAVINKPDYKKAIRNKTEVLFRLSRYMDCWHAASSLLKLAPGNFLASKWKFLSNQHIGVKFVFANVDLKLLQNGEIKILEFGPGKQSGWNGIQTVTNKPIMDHLREAMDPIRQAFDCPPIVLTMPGIGTPFDRPEMLTLLQGYESSEPLCCPADFRHFDGIVGCNRMPPASDRFLRMDNPIIDTIFENKQMMHEIFVNMGLESARPQTLILQKHFSQKLVKQIREGIPGDRYVLKAPDCDRGEGVLIVEDADLVSTLKVLLCDPNKSKKLVKLLHKSVLDFQTVINWSLASNLDTFMVEEYLEPNVMDYGGEQYDPTFRVPILYLRDANHSQLTLLEPYAKLPPDPLATAKSVRSGTVSSFSPTHTKAAMLTGEQKQLILPQLEALLPNLFNTMLAHNIFDALDLFLKNDQVSDASKANRLLHLSNTFALHGELVFAEHILEKAQTQFHPVRYYHQKALILTLKGQIQEALTCYGKGLSIEGESDSTYYRRGQLYMMMGNLKAARADMTKACEINPSYRAKVHLGEIFQQESSQPKLVFQRYKEVAEYAVQVKRFGLAAYAFRSAIEIKSLSELFKFNHLPIGAVMKAYSESQMLDKASKLLTLASMLVQTTEKNQLNVDSQMLTSETQRLEELDKRCKQFKKAKKLFKTQNYQEGLTILKFLNSRIKKSETILDLQITQRLLSDVAYYLGCIYMHNEKYGKAQIHLECAKQMRYRLFCPMSQAVQEVEATLQTLELAQANNSLADANI